MSDYSKPPTKILISVLVFVGIMGGYIHFIQGMNTQYASDLPVTELNSTFTRFGGIQQDVEDLENATTETIKRSETTSLAGLILEGLQGMWNTLKVTLGAVPDIVQDIQEIIGLPSWFINLVIVILSIILTAAIIKVVLGREL